MRGATFSLAPWIFAVTLMAPTMAWLQDVVSPAEARAAANADAEWKPANPCTAVASEGTEAASPWLLRMMSLMAHLVYGGIVGLMYQRRAEP